MLLNSVAGMELYEKEQDAEFNMYQKPHPGLYPHNFDPMSMEMTKIPMQLQLHQQQKAHFEPRRERKKLPVEEHEHWVALVWTDSKSKPHLRSSSNMNFCKSIVLDEATPKFAHYVKQVKYGGFAFDEGLPFGSGFNDPAEPPAMHAERDSCPRANKRKKGLEDAECSDDSRRVNERSRYRDDDPNDGSSSDVHFRADARDEWSKWFYNAFRAVQQQACRTIAKEWIKTIHPKKQSTHPYNGKNPKTGEKGDPASTKPPYWPDSVKHKEPDHINKEDRTQLLVHLLMNTPHLEMSISGEPKSTKEITAEMLKEPLVTKKHTNVDKELLKRFHIVEQIIEVRSRLEQFEYGGISGDTILSAPDYSSYNRGTRSEQDSADEEEMADMAENDESLDDADTRTEMTPEDAEYVVIDRPTVPQAPIPVEATHTGRSSRRQSKSKRPQGSRAAGTSGAADTSFTSVSTQGQMGMLDPSISPEWQHFHRPGPEQSPAQMYTQEHMWGRPMSMQMSAAPFPTHGMVSPPPHPMDANGLVMGGVPMGDGRYMNRGPYCHPPMYIADQYGGQPEHTEMRDARGIPIRSRTPPEFFIGHPTPPDPNAPRGYYQ